MKSLFILLLLIPTFVFAQNNNQQAANKAKELLNNPAMLEQYIQQHSEAQAADQKVRSLGGNEANTQKIYQMASEIFAQLVQQYNGDPNAMLNAMMQAQQNPEAFAASFTPAQKAQLKALAKDIEDSRR